MFKLVSYFEGYHDEKFCTFVCFCVSMWTDCRICIWIVFLIISTVNKLLKDSIALTKYEIFKHCFILCILGSSKDATDMLQYIFMRGIVYKYTMCTQHARILCVLELEMHVFEDIRTYVHTEHAATLALRHWYPLS